jgi:hypothetical protein
MNYRLLLALPLLLAGACKGDDPAPDPIGGKGGNAALLITPYHHSRMIDSLTVYIKYNTLDMPAGAYDDSVRCMPSNGLSLATFSGLKKGRYYLYGKGYDPLIPDVVLGGMPVTITEETTRSMRLQVSEDGH